MVQLLSIYLKIKNRLVGYQNLNWELSVSSKLANGQCCVSTLEESRKKKRKPKLTYLYKQSNLPAHGTQETTFWKVPSPLSKTPLPSPFPKAKKKKNIPSHSRNHYFGKGVRKIVLERGSSFEREETKYLIFLLPLLKFSLITLSHPTSPDPIQL